MDEFMSLPKDDPIYMGGIDLFKDFNNYKQRNKFTRYLKMAMGAYDPYIYYFLCIKIVFKRSYIFLDIL
jgi:uncharacterized membrane protein YobD (UPF0266 family)